MGLVFDKPVLDAVPKRSHHAKPPPPKVASKSIHDFFSKRVSFLIFFQEKNSVKRYLGQGAVSVNVRLLLTCIRWIHTCAQLVAARPKKS